MKATMHVRTPDIGPDQGPLLWSTILEFAMAYNSYSIVIPHVEYYLNNTMNQVRIKFGKTNPELDQELVIFVKQEVQHSRYHNNFNKRMLDEGIEGLSELMLRHYGKSLAPEQKHQSLQPSKKLFWRQLRYVAPRMLQILLLGYDPSRLPVPFLNSQHLLRSSALSRWACCRIKVRRRYSRAGARTSIFG